MTSAHSVSIALRAIVWTRTACESGLGRLVFDRRTDGLHIDIPRARIKSTLGLSLEPTIKTLNRLIPMWIADMRLIHIDADFTVVRDGNAIAALRCRFRTLPVTVYGQPAFRTRRLVSLYTETIQRGHAVDTVMPPPKRSYRPRNPRTPAEPIADVFGVPMAAFEPSTTPAPIPPRPTAPRRPTTPMPPITATTRAPVITPADPADDYDFYDPELDDDDF